MRDDALACWCHLGCVAGCTGNKQTCLQVKELCSVQQGLKYACYQKRVSL